MHLENVIGRKLQQISNRDECYLQISSLHFTGTAYGTSQSSLVWILNDFSSEPDPNFEVVPDPDPKFPSLDIGKLNNFQSTNTYGTGALL